MAIPANGSLALSFPLAGSAFAALCFSVYFVNKYRDRREQERSWLVTSCLGLAITLLTCVMLPVDIFIVSFMKTSDGKFKDWATNVTERNDIEETIMITYYVLYAIIFFFTFIAIPFMYFFYEEKSDDLEFENPNRFCTSLKYTFILFLVCAVLLSIGAFVPLKGAPDNTTSEWDRIQAFIDELEKNRGEDAIEMVLSILSVLGVINVIFYTGFGVASWPIGLIRGSRSVKKQLEEISNQHLVNQMRINTLREKERMSGGRLTQREQSQLSQLQEIERSITQEEKHLEGYRRGWFYRLRHPIRFIQIWTGVGGLAAGLVIWLSLLLVHIDKAMNGLGPRMGYALDKPNLPNPLDLLLVTFQKVFPLDYVLILIITLFLLMCTISGLRNLGVRVFFLKAYDLRQSRTPPQGLLITCATLMLTVLGLNILLYNLSPQYATFGAQHYNNDTQLLGSSVTFARLQSGNGTVPITDLLPCATSVSEKYCTMTRASTLLLRFFYKIWIFGAIYYWAFWLFIAIIPLAAIYVTLRGPRSAVQHLLRSDDLDDEELITP